MLDLTLIAEKPTVFSILTTSAKWRNQPASAKPINRKETNKRSINMIAKYFITLVLCVFSSAVCALAAKYVIDLF